VKRLFMSWVI